MKFFRASFLLVFLALSFWHCDTNIVATLKDNYTGDRITISGSICVDSINLVIGKSTDAYSTINEAKLTALNIYAFIEDESKTLNYKLSSVDGINFKAGNIGLKPGSTYRIVVSADNLKTAMTDWITIPQPTTLENITSIKNPASGRVSNDVSFSFQDQPGIDYYFFRAALVKSKVYSGALVAIPDEIINGSCYAIGVFKDQCFEGKKISLTYQVYTDSYFSGFKGSQIGDSIAFRFGKVSKEVYLNQLAQPTDDGIISGINEPPLSYSNVQNGYGVVYAYHLKDYKLAILK
jgi:hypothetical protein